MNVASLELCDQLADYLPCNGETTEWVYVLYGDDLDWTLIRREAVVGAPMWVAAPDLGWLVRKLPPEINSETIELVIYGGHWEAAYSGARDRLWNQQIGSQAADTAEDAACQLLIELFKQKILPKGDTDA